MSDLMALTLGVAFASSLFWYQGSPNSTVFIGKPDPRWYFLLSFALELAQKACVALLPLLLFRRWMYGKDLRAWEYLPILTASFQVSFSMSHWPIWGLYYRDPNFANGLSVNVEALYAWNLAKVCAGMTALLVALLLRHRPRWRLLQVILGLVAWYLMTETLGYLYQQWANSKIFPLSPDRQIVRWLSALLVQLPLALQYQLPTGLAILALVRSRPRSWTWVDATAFSLGLPLTLAFLIRTVVQGYFFPTRFAADPVFFLIQYGTIAIDYVLIRWLCDRSKILHSLVTSPDDSSEPLPL